MYIDCTTEKRFWKHVNKLGENDCWEWLASCHPYGYGQIEIGTGGYKRPYLAHRISWIIHNGEIPVGLCILHKCDNPSCVNPVHLFLGTKADNTHDMINKGRMSRGEKHPGAKLTPTDVKEIRQLRTQGVRAILISEIYNINRDYVYEIARKETWKHI